MTPKVSIIVPIYNVEKYLNKCLDSIIAQTFADFEVVLVDDGSPDGCPAICDEYAEKDNRIVVIHKSNGGLSDARNAGLDVAKGEYIYFCDSDDYIDKNLLSETIKKMDSGSDMTIFQYIKIKEDGSVYYSSEGSAATYLLNNNSRLDFIVNDLLSGKVTWMAWNRIYRRSIIEENGIRFVENKRIFAEDLCFCLYYCAFAERIDVVENHFYYYLQRESSIMGTDKTKGNLGRLSFLCESVYDFWNSQQGTAGLSEHFSIVYYSILYPEIKRMMAFQGISEKDIRERIFKSIENREFFFSNCDRLLRDFHFIRHSLFDIEYYQKKNEAKYWIKGNYITYRFNAFLLNSFVIIGSFFKKVKQFINCRFSRVK